MKELKGNNNYNKLIRDKLSFPYYVKKIIETLNET